MHAAAQQPLLPELAPPLPPPDQVPRFAVWGLLEEDARVFTSHGFVHLQVLVAQHLQAHPEARHVLATYVYPDHGTPQATEIAAHSAARRMRTRSEVIVSGQALVPGTYAGKPVSRLLEVRGIRLADEVIQHAHESRSPLEA